MPHIKELKRSNVTVSTRSQIFLEGEEFMVSKMGQCGTDKYSPSNKYGYLNLGTAQNFLCEELISKWIKRSGNFEHQADWQQYTPLEGHVSVRKVAANFLTDYFSPQTPIEAENIRIIKGVSVCTEALGFALFERGDVVITPTPTYSRYYGDFGERAGVKVIGLPLIEEDDFLLDATKLENLILKLKRIGYSVKGFLFCNPSNPLGEIYSLDVAQNLMRVCAKYEMHFISDEIFAMSVHDTESEFKSILSIPSLVDPSRTHFMWGMSKDLGVAGFRFGLIHTRNKDVLKVLAGMAGYIGVPAHIQELSAKMLDDKEWLQEIYFPNNIIRLQSNYKRFVTFLQSKHGLYVRKSSAGFFVWVNFSRFLQEKTVVEEMKLFNQLFDEYKIYINPGSTTYANDPGWFRIIFTMKEEEIDEFERRFDAYVRTFEENLNRVENNKKVLDE